MARTLIFNFDGTGNEPADVGSFSQDESISNVLKLHVILGGCMEAGKNGTKTANGNDQKTYYYNGIGTREGRFSIPLVGRVRSAINMAVAPSWGDARGILNEAIGDCKAADCKSDDTIVVFGFSRGAALARKFVSMVLARKLAHEISFLGVFDTVAAMDGIFRKGDIASSDVLFENGTLDRRVKRAVHLLALDEERVPFTPTLINRDTGQPSRITEIWMPGVHSDVGGGYWMDGLADESLQVMIKMCRAELKDEIEFKQSTEEIRQTLASEAQAERLEDITADDVVVRPVVHGVLHANISGLKKKVVQQDPRDVHVCRNDRPVRIKNLQEAEPEDIPLVHKAVMQRFSRVGGYRPAALRGQPFRLFGEPGEPVLKGIADLRDHVEKKKTRQHGQP